MRWHNSIRVFSSPCILFRARPLHHPFGSQARCVQRLRTILDGIPLRREMAEVMVSLFPFSVTPTLLGDNCPENYSFYFAANAYVELSSTKHL